MKHSISKYTAACFLVLNTALAAHTPVSQAADSPVLTDYDWQALYIVKFGMSYVEWPEPIEAGQLKKIDVCIYGSSPVFVKSLESFKAKTAQKLQVNIRDNLQDTDISGCDIAYIPRGKSNYRELVGSLKTRPVLTVAPIEGFASNGGVMEFIFVESGKPGSGAPFSPTGNVTFKINNKAAVENHLKIATEALESAKEVIK